MDLPAGLELAAGMHHRLVPVVAERLEKQQFGWCAGVACSEEPCTEDSCRVEYDCVTRRNQLREVAERSMLERRACPVHNHQPRLIPPLGRMLGYEVAWKIVVIVVCAGTVRSHVGSSAGEVLLHVHAKRSLCMERKVYAPGAACRRLTRVGEGTFNWRGSITHTTFWYMKVVSDRVITAAEQRLRARQKKEKTSVSLSGEVVAAMDIIAGKAGRSAFIERAVRAKLRRMIAAARNRKDLEAINRNAAATNRESDRVLDIQSWPE